MDCSPLGDSQINLREAKLSPCACQWVAFTAWPACAQDPNTMLPSNSLCYLCNGCKFLPRTTQLAQPGSGHSWKHSISSKVLLGGPSCWVLAQSLSSAPGSPNTVILLFFEEDTSQWETGALRLPVTNTVRARVMCLSKKSRSSSLWKRGKQSNAFLSHEHCLPLPRMIIITIS